MTPEQAIQIIDQVLAQVSANRQVHLQIEAALACLRNMAKLYDTK